MNSNSDVYFSDAENHYGTSHPLYGAVPPKIYESPDKGKTIYERQLGAHPSTRKLVKTSVQQQWNITFNGEKVDL